MALRRQWRAVNNNNNNSPLPITPAPNALSSPRRRRGLTSGARVIALLLLVALVLTAATARHPPRLVLRCHLKAVLQRFLSDRQFSTDGGYWQLVGVCCAAAGSTRLIATQLLEGALQGRTQATRYYVTPPDGGVPEGLPPVSSCHFCWACHLDAGAAGIDTQDMAAWQPLPETVQPQPAARRLLVRQPWAALGDQAAHTPAGQPGNSSSGAGSAAPGDEAEQQDDQGSNAGGTTAALPAAVLGPVDPRAHLPACESCTACSHALAPLATEVEQWGVRYKQQGVGASSALIFKARTQRGKGGEAAVKLWCLPFDKKTGNMTGPKCSPPTGPQVATKDSGTVSGGQLALRKLQALDVLIDDCGFRELFSRVWQEHVRAILPGTGYAVDQEGVFMDLARGVPLHTATFSTPPEQMQSGPLNALHNVDSDLVVKAAIFDLLTSQCDRHADNVFLWQGEKDGKPRLTLIDNDQMLGEAWRACGVDSIFLPTTQKFEINVNGFYYVMREQFPKRNTHPKGVPNPQLLLDYRCHVKGGKIGTSYPVSVQRCLERISAMTPPELVDTYGFSRPQSVLLRIRARDMLNHGFEWTLEQGEPQNPPQLRYPWQPSCCSMEYVGEVDSKDSFRCLDRWEPQLANGTRLAWKPPLTEKEWEEATVALAAKQKQAGGNSAGVR